MCTNICGVLYEDCYTANWRDLFSNRFSQPKRIFLELYVVSGHKIVWKWQWLEMFFRDSYNALNRELPDVHTGFTKGRGTRDQIPNIHGIIKKASEFQKNISFCFIDYTKAFDCVDHNKLWNILKEMGIPDHLTCLLRNLYAGQEATVRTGHGTTDWFQIGKGVCQWCILSP